MGQIKAALVKDSIVQNIIVLDVDQKDKDIQEYAFLQEQYEKDLKDRQALQSKFTRLQKRLNDYKYKRDFVLTDGQEFDKKYGKTVKGIIKEKDNLEKILSKPLQIPRKPKNVYIPHEGFEVYVIGDNECKIGWVYKDGNFEAPETVEIEAQKEDPKTFTEFIKGGNIGS